MATSPTVRLRRLTAELRRLREARNLTIESVAQSIGVSKSAISRMENGLVNPRLPVLDSLIRIYQVPDGAAEDLRRLRKEASQQGWWQSGTAARDDAKTLVGLEQEATRVDDFSGAVLTGLLQTPEYAEAIVRAGDPELTDEEVAAAVGFRTRRRERLGHLRLWVIIAEEVLLRPVGGGGVMRAQLEHVIELGRRTPRTTIQVLGLESGAHAGLPGGFTVLGFERDPEVAYVEGNQWDACVEDRGTVEVYKSRFNSLRALALSPSDSLQRLSERAKGFAS